MPDEAFREPMNQASRGFLQALNRVRELPTEDWTEALLSELSLKAGELERFLDAHGARRNETYYPIRKTVACLLWISHSISCLVHLRGRLGVYPSADPQWTTCDLPTLLAGTVRGLGEELNKIAQALEDQWVTSCLEWEPLSPPHPVEDHEPSLILSANRSDTSEKGEKGEASPAARLATRFLRFLEVWSQEVKNRATGGPGMLTFVEEYCKERTARSFQTRAHIWQSDYDSLVRGSKEEEQHPELAELRGAMSQALHLLEATTSLAHLFERHRPGLPETMGPAVSNFLEDDRFLCLWLDGCVIPAFRSLEAAKPAAQALVNNLIKRTWVSCTLPPGVHLHARPLSLLVQIVQHHGLPVTLRIGEETASAESLIQMLLLVGNHPSTRELTLEGDNHALKDIEILIASGMGEGGVAQLPTTLDYLKS
jgi:phosphotransferase system HPr-like phosphotransfer protein